MATAVIAAKRQGPHNAAAEAAITARHAGCTAAAGDFESLGQVRLLPPYPLPRTLQPVLCSAHPPFWYLVVMAGICPG